MLVGPVPHVDQARADGGAMTLKQAIAYALSEPTSA